MIECPAARALDLQFGEALGGGEFTVALATADVFHTFIILGSCTRGGLLCQGADALSSAQSFITIEWLRARPLHLVLHLRRGLRRRVLASRVCADRPMRRPTHRLRQRHL